MFGRVLGSNPAPEDTTARDYSMLGIDGPEAQPSTNGHGQSNAYALENSEPDIEVQTADTQRLPQIAPEFLGRNGGASHSQIAPEEIADEFGDSVLDLGVFSGGKAFAGDDPFLDVLDEEASTEDFFVEAVPEASALAEDSSDAAASVPAFEEREYWAVATETVEVAHPGREAEESAPASSASQANLSGLSAEAIDAIARRVVERLSDKVVREIAWEVVPELSELLIKQKLREK